MDIPSSLKLKQLNPASYSDASGWLADSQYCIDSINPSTGEPIAQVQLCTEQHYEAIVNDAAQSFKSWREVPAPKRGELIRQIGAALRDNKDALGSLVAMEMGKIKQEGDGEVQEMIDMADFAVGQSRMLYGKTMHSERPQHRMYEQWHPLGIVGVITAFNFPVAVWAWNAFIAAIAGNVVIWKPSSKVPLCAIAVQQICNQVMRDNGHPGVFSQFVPNSSAITDRFVGDKRIPLVSFTGSSRTGNKVATTVATRMGKTLLECSGNNAVIIDESADLDLAIPAVVFGAVGTAGQRCTTTRRLLVHESLVDRIQDALINAYEQVKIGNALDPEVLMGPLIHQSAVDDYLSTIQAIGQQGKLIYGGKRLPGKGFFVKPSLAMVPEDSHLLQTETFAPILYILPFHDLEHAIALQNQVPQGLSSAIFTNRLQHAEQFLAATGSDCGIANVNIGTSGAEIGGAFGGEKLTGGGREAGSDSWKAYMRRQTTTINWGTELPLAQGIEFKLKT